MQNVVSDQGSNSCPPLLGLQSLPVNHQESPCTCIINTHLLYEKHYYNYGRLKETLIRLYAKKSPGEENGNPL